MFDNKSFVSKRIFWITGLFSIFLFIYMVTATMINKSSTGYISASEHISMYYIDQVCVVAGYVLFAFLWGKIREDRIKAGVIRSLSLIFFFMVLLIILYPGRLSFLVFAPIANVALGFLGGVFHYYISVALADSDCIGRIIATGALFAYLLQYWVQISTDNKLLLILFIIAGMVLVVVMVRRSWEWLLADCLLVAGLCEGDRLVRRDRFRSLVTAVTVSLLAVLLLTYYDSMILKLMVDSDLTEVTTYSWPRLFAVLGYLVMGFAGDHRKKSYSNIMMFIMMLWLLISPVIFEQNPVSNINMVLFYIVVGGTMCYMYQTFFSLAPYTANMEVTASLGRIIEGLGGVAFAFIPWGNLSLMQVMIIGIAIVSMTFFMLLYNGDFARVPMDDFEAGDHGKTGEPAGKEHGGSHDIELVDITRCSGTELYQNIDDDTLVGHQMLNDQEKELSDNEMDTKEGYTNDDTLVTMSEKYGLTQRERQVLEKLLFSEDSGQEISDSLSISRRVFQRHVASIYEKTKTKSRVGLYRLYHDEMDGNSGY